VAAVSNPAHKLTQIIVNAVLSSDVCIGDRFANKVAAI
jgi:hypothetical protein